MNKTEIGFARATSALAPPTPPPSASASARRQDYVTRRLALWEGPAEGATYTEVEMGAVARLPVPLQVAFRRKMLGIFALQLLVVGAVVAVFRYVPAAKARGDAWLGTWTRVVFALLAALGLLVGLYALRNRFPLNWLLLGLFSAAQSALFVGLGVVVDTNVGVFNCAFTLTWVALLIALAGVERRRRQGDIEYDDIDNDHGLLSTFYAGAAAYILVAAISTGLYLVFGDRVASSTGFGFTLLFQFFLVLWFSYDASSMYRVMSPDEYMHGVLYFYTDLILLAIISAIAVGTVIVCAAMCSGDGGAADASDCCVVCYCPGTLNCVCCDDDKYSEQRQRREAAEAEAAASAATMDRV